MKNVSNLFKQVIEEGGPFYAYASVKLADGTTFTLDANDDFYISGNNYSQSGGGGFPLGSVISKTIDIAIDNTDGRFSGYDFYKAEITLYTEADIAYDPILKDVSDDAITDHSGNNIITDYAKTERILEGIFTVASPVSTGDLIEIVAYDGVKKLDSVYTPTNAIVFPTTAMAIYQDICNRRGLSVGSSTFPNSDYQIDSIPENVTCRQMIGYIAMIAVGNAFCSATNALIIKPYDFSLFENMPLISGGNFGDGVSDSVAGGSFGDALEDYISANELGDGDYHILSDFPSDFTVSTDDVVITGIKIDVETEGEEGTETETLLYGTEGYCLKVENPLASGKEEDLIEIIGDALIGTILRPFSGEFFPDPTIEFMDLVYLIDRKDNIYQSFITDNTFTYLGNSELSNDMEDPTRNESEYYSQATEVYRKNRQEIDNLKTTYEIALEQLANQIATSSGLYTTEEVQEDGSTIFYMHDKPTLEESQIIWTMTANAFAVSNDGGKSYVAGLTVDGNLIANILTAIGINADWINSGAITIKDQNGNITFLADTATGNVEIRANTFTLGSQTIPEIAEEKLQNMQIGGRNLLLGTGTSKSTTYTGVTNDTGSTLISYNFSEYALSKMVDNKTVTISFDWAASGTLDGRFHIQTAYSHYTSLTGGYIYISDDNSSGHFENTVTINTAIDFTMIRVIGAESHSTLTISNLKIEIGNKATDWSPAPEDTETYADNLAADLQEQIDGKIETYNQTSDPSASWTTTDLKTQHTGDLWYNPNTKITQRWSGTAWVALESAEAEEASELAKTKSTIFTTTPTVPYYVGDTWFNSSTSDIMTCIRDRTSGSYSSSDWQKRNKYTDDSAVTELDNNLNADGVFNRLTNNGAMKGIYKTGNQLYINADYIATGSLDAKRIEFSTNSMGYLGSDGRLYIASSGKNPIDSTVSIFFDQFMAMQNPDFDYFIGTADSIMNTSPDVNFIAFHEPDNAEDGTGGNAIGFGVSSGGWDRGIYDYVEDQWLIRKDQSNNVAINGNNVTIDGANYTPEQVNVFVKCGRVAMVNAWGTAATAVCFTLGEGWRPIGSGTRAVASGWAYRTGTRTYFPCVCSWGNDGTCTCYAISDSNVANNNYVIYGGGTDNRSLFTLFLHGAWLV